MGKDFPSGHLRCVFFGQVMRGPHQRPPLAPAQVHVQVQVQVQVQARLKTSQSSSCVSCGLTPCLTASWQPRARRRARGECLRKRPSGCCFQLCGHPCLISSLQRTTPALHGVAVALYSLEPPCRCGLRFGRLVHARELQRLVHVAVSTNDLPLLLIAVKLLLCEHDAEAAGGGAPGATSSSLTLTEELKDLGARYGALPYQREVVG